MNEHQWVCIYSVKGNDAQVADNHQDVWKAPVLQTELNQV